MIVLDTNILIDISRDKLDIKTLQSKYGDLFINHIISMEILQGALNKIEQRKIIKLLSKCKHLELTDDILDLAKELVIAHNLSHNLKIYDAIIAATCLIYDLSLLTYNTRDFEYIEEIKIIR